MLHIVILHNQARVNKTWLLERSEIWKNDKLSRNSLRNNRFLHHILIKVLMRKWYRPPWLLGRGTILRFIWLGHLFTINKWNRRFHCNWLVINKLLKCLKRDPTQQFEFSGLCNVAVFLFVNGSMSISSSSIARTYMS